MIVYMLRKGTSWYKRSSGYPGHWVDQQHASVWQSKRGPAASKGQWLRHHPQEELEIVSFKLEKL